MLAAAQAAAMVVAGWDLDEADVVVDVGVEAVVAAAAAAAAPKYC